jgi:hypothetical protein
MWMAPYFGQFGEVTKASFGSTIAASDSGGSMVTLVVPKSALRILEMTLDIVTMRANANGELFGEEIADAMVEAGNQVGMDRLEVLLVRTLLVRTMESLGENYPSQLLHNHETRMRVSDAIKYLREAIAVAARLANSAEAEMVVI